MSAGSTYRLRDFPNAVCARGLTKTFARGLARAARRTVALHEVDIDLRCGELLGLAGPEGAGKTTLLQCLCGLLKRDGGKVEVLGEPFDGCGCAPGISYVPAVPVFYPFFTVRDVLESRFARSLITTRRSYTVENVLRALDLSSIERCRISGLPREALRRLAIAEAVVSEPAVILVDTAASAVDPPVSAVSLKALQDCACAGAAVVVAARDASSIALGATRILLLDRGRIVRTFSLESLGEPIVDTPSPLLLSRRVAERVH
jgi:ABC-type multidrug transport system ATPase subunit